MKCNKWILGLLAGQGGAWYPQSFWLCSFCLESFLNQISLSFRSVKEIGKRWVSLVDQSWNHTFLLAVVGDSLIWDIEVSPSRVFFFINLLPQHLPRRSEEASDPQLNTIILLHEDNSLRTYNFFSRFPLTLRLSLYQRPLSQEKSSRLHRQLLLHTLLFFARSSTRLHSPVAYQPRFISQIKVKATKASLIWEEATFRAISEHHHVSTFTSQIICVSHSINLVICQENLSSQISKVATTVHAIWATATSPRTSKNSFWSYLPWAHTIYANISFTLILANNIRRIFSPYVRGSTWSVA